jgi:hypothetical protein
MSAFYDQASLVVVPSGYKSGKIYAQKPLTTDGQLTFTRASTATRVNASGLIESVASGVPRLDYQGSTCPKLLLEPQRSNTITWSEGFDNANWTKSNTTITANAIASPDGATTADFIVPTTTNGLHSALQVGAGVSSGTHTLSVFAKKGVYKNLLVWFDGHSGGIGVNLDTLAIFRNENNSGYKIENYGNGWVRISVTCTVSVTSPPNFYIYDNSSTPAISYAGNGTDGLYLWGAMFEAGAYATSYVKTEGAAVTRLADDASKTGISSLIGQTNGTFFVDVTFGNSRNSWFFSLASNSWLNDAFYLEAFGASNYIATSTVKNSAGAGSATSTFVAAAGVRAKVAVQYTSTTLNMFINGVKYTGTRTAIPACTGLYLNQIGTFGANDSQYNANQFNQVLTFTSALTDAQCIELTTL